MAAAWVVERRGAVTAHQATVVLPVAMAGLLAVTARRVMAEVPVLMAVRALRVMADRVMGALRFTVDQVTEALQEVTVVLGAATVGRVMEESQGVWGLVWAEEVPETALVWVSSAVVQAGEVLEAAVSAVNRTWPTC